LIATREPRHRYSGSLTHFLHCRPPRRDRVAVGVYEALPRMERKRLVTRDGEGWRNARWRLTSENVN
jgi:hypothetical protein